MRYAGWVSYLLSTVPTWGLRFAVVMISHAVVGILHIQITLSHFAMPAYRGTGYDENDNDHFIKVQLETTLVIIRAIFFLYKHFDKIIEWNRPPKYKVSHSNSPKPYGKSEKKALFSNFLILFTFARRTKKITFFCKKFEEKMHKKLLSSLSRTKITLCRKKWF